MKTRIYKYLAILTVFATILTGCANTQTTTGPTTPHGITSEDTSLNHDTASTDDSLSTEENGSSGNISSDDFIAENNQGNSDSNLNTDSDLNSDFNNSFDSDNNDTSIPSYDLDDVVSESTSSGNTSGEKDPDKLTSSTPSDNASEESKLAQDILNKIITSGMGDFEKAKAIHDYLLMNVDYDYENYLNDTIPAESYTILGALKYKIAVCAGYAKAFELLCHMAGLECTYITGNTPQGYHAWNQVKIDNQWYNVDVTWDDPINLEKAFDDHRYNNYSYFLISDEIMYKDHTPFGDVQKCPASLNTKAYEAGAPWLDSTYPMIHNFEELSALAKNAVANDITEISMTFSSSFSDLRSMAEIVQGALLENAAWDFGITKYSYINIKNTAFYSVTYYIVFNNPKQTSYTKIDRLCTYEDVKELIPYLLDNYHINVAVSNELLESDALYKAAVWAWENYDVSMGYSEMEVPVSDYSTLLNIYMYPNNYYDGLSNIDTYPAKDLQEIEEVILSLIDNPKVFRVVYRYGDEIGRLSYDETVEYVETVLAPQWEAEYCISYRNLYIDSFICVMMIEFSNSNHHGTQVVTLQEPTCIADGLNAVVCGKCHNTLRTYTTAATGVHNTYWTYETEITRHLSCHNCDFTGPTLQQYGQVWGYFDEESAKKLFDGICEKRAASKYIHRDYKGNFISSETPPPLTWDDNLYKELRTMSVCIGTGIQMGEYAQLPYDVLHTVQRPSDYIPVDSVIYSRGYFTGHLENLDYSRLATVCFYFDSDNTGLNMKSIWCAYFA